MLTPARRLHRSPGAAATGDPLRADLVSRKRSIQAGRDAALAALAELRSRIAAKTK